MENYFVWSIESLTNCIKDIVDKQIDRFVFRGQPDSNFALDCGATRRINKQILLDNPRNVLEVKKKDLLYYHVNLVEEAKLKGYHLTGRKNLSTLELLAELQHFGCATMLVDFTRNVLISLFFACRSHYDKNGAIYILQLNDVENLIGIDYKTSQDEGEDILTTILDEQNDFLYFWEPRKINERINPQKSIFIFGKPIIDNYYRKIIIYKEFKKYINKQLELLYDINESTLFNDFYGFAQQTNNHTAETKLFSWKYYYEKAREYSQMNDLEKKNISLDFYNKSLDLSPDNSELLYERSLLKNKISELHFEMEIEWEIQDDPFEEEIPLGKRIPFDEIPYEEPYSETLSKEAKEDLEKAKKIAQINSDFSLLEKIEIIEKKTQRG